ncbi:MAG: CBS domain-containing protein [Thermoanaerobaculales bacterium]|nr:CBS domain-containing protein [Thermoanaerobaculales bacterium]
MTAPTVRDVMRKPSRTFPMKMPMPEAAGILARSPFAAAPVVDENGAVVGLLTEKDCLRAVGRWAYEGISGGVVKDYMSEMPVRLTPQMDLLSASLVFSECNFSCLPVMDDDKLIGRLLRHELLRALENWATEINRELADRVTRSPDHQRPSAIPHMLKVVGSATREQISQIFKKT